MQTAMKLQKDADEIASALNIRAKYLLVPVALETTTKTLVASAVDPSKTNNTPNPIHNTVEVLSDARLDQDSASKWYGAADQNRHDTIEVSYLDGNQNPTLESRDGWNVEGKEFKVRIDAGVTALSEKGLYQNPGA